MKRVNEWNVLSEFYEEKSRKFYKVECSKCGNVVERVRSDGLKKRICDCSKIDTQSKIIESGTRFHMLVVNSISHRDNGVYYNVTCDCGVTKILSGSQLRNGSTKSCGCYKESLLGRKIENHGLSNTKEYSIWTSIICRTSHPIKSTRKWYYDKGVKISEEWRNSFLKFYEDMGECPDGFTIDRIDPDGDYCKENCRWASVELQSINKGLSSNNTSGNTGVSFDKNSGKWVAYIYRNWKRYHLGTFSSKEEAIDARVKGEETYWSDINE